MFYFRELYFRLQYILFSLTLTLFICYLYKDYLLLLYIYPLLFKTLDSSNNLFEIDSFIYTHPTEIFSMYIYMIFFNSFFFLVPLIIWNIFDFLKQSFYYYEYHYLKKKIFFLYFLYFLYNYISLFYLFPKVWFLFEHLNKPIFLNMFFELKVNDYIYFLFDYIYLFNISFFLLFIFFLLLKSIGIKSLIYWKKLLIVFNLVFATLLSPPDINSQIILLLVLTFFFEGIFLFFVFKTKNKKNF